MKTAPDLDERVIAGALASGWELETESLRYAALGFGSHHWVAVARDGRRWFVTVDELDRLDGEPDVAFARLAAAFETARRLRDSGLEFVVAPLADAHGDVLRRITGAFTVSVFPHVDGSAGSFGEYGSPAEVRAVRALLERLHDATAIVSDVAWREDFSLPCRPQLEAALGELDRPWTGGPYAESTRRLLKGIVDELRAALEAHDRLVATVRSEPGRWAVTHGEPHPGNVLWTDDGPVLVDWDTALIAPSGRDWWHLRPSGETSDEDGDAELYRLRWGITDIALFVTQFREPHVSTADTVAAWHHLEHYAGRIGAGLSR
jgi:Phosphotransferase enzyme family